LCLASGILQFRKLRIGLHKTNPRTHPLRQTRSKSKMSTERFSRTSFLWIFAAISPFAIVPVSIAFRGSLPGRIGTATGLLAALLVAICAFTDFRWHRIPNWATYNAVFWALILNVGAELTDRMASGATLHAAPGNVGPDWLGTPGLGQCL